MRWRFEMTVQEKIQAHKRTLLMLTGTLAVAFGAFASTAAGGSSYRSEGAKRAMPPIEVGDIYSRVHPPREVLRGATIPEGQMVVNTAGVASQHGVLVLVDDSSHVVNAKGLRLGGRPLDIP
jgi:hypothetical protein